MSNKDPYRETLKLYDDPVYAKSYADNIADRLDMWNFEEFLPHITPGSTILDIGCAAGRDSNYLSTKGYNVTGIDMSRELLKIAQTKYPDINFIQGNMLKMPFLDYSFDAIWSHAAIVHLPSQADVKQAVQESVRVLRPQGHIMLLTKARTDQEPESIIRNDKLSGKNRYFRFQTEGELIKICEESGLAVLRSKFYNEQEGEKHNILRDENWVFIIAKKIS